MHCIWLHSAEIANYLKTHFNSYIVMCSAFVRYVTVLLSVVLCWQGPLLPSPFGCKIKWKEIGRSFNIGSLPNFGDMNTYTMLSFSRRSGPGHGCLYDNSQVGKTENDMHLGCPITATALAILLCFRVRCVTSSIDQSHVTTVMLTYF